MQNLFFDSVDDLSTAVVPGSSARLKCGCAITRNARGDAPRGWVNRDTTIIVGCHPRALDKGQEASSVEWVLPVERRFACKAHGALLVICCDRVQGGLHTQKEGATARVHVNDQEVDLIGLREKPTGHTDYFHRVAHQEIPPVPLIKNCGTVYSFNVPPSFLEKNGTQKITIFNDPGVYWDIDHVVFVLKYRKNRIRPWVVGAVSAIFAGAVGVAASEGWKLFVGRGP